MSSKTPIVRQVSWWSSVPQLSFMGLLILVYSFFVTLYTAFILGAATYLLLSYFSRVVICRYHRAGILLSKSGRFEEAIVQYEKSYAFFSKYAWIDHFRFITLLSSSRISFTEMALVNTAFCYAQIGNGPLAKQYYEKALAQFPDSGMAKAALNLINSITAPEQK